MKRSTERILTTHVGKLPAPDDLAAEVQADPRGRPTSEDFAARLRSAVADVVRRQTEAGIDIVDDGEVGKTHWNTYLVGRLGGYEVRPRARARSLDRTIGEWAQFGDFYAEGEKSDHLMYYHQVMSASARDSEVVCSGPITYIGQTALQQDIDNLTAAMVPLGIEEGFMPSTVPSQAVAAIVGGNSNLHYPNEEAYLFAMAEAMKVEYQAIVAAGLILQLDMPRLVGGDKGIEELRIEALNHALAGIAEDRVRLHVCWGGWNGPHTDDPSVRDAIPAMFKVRAGAYSIEAANPRHEHEWQTWQDVKLPEGKVLIPGLISQKTNVVEHPELIAWRIKLYAGVVGKENLIVSTDCGLGSRVHPQIAWAKLEALAEGARLASRELWGR